MESTLETHTSHCINTIKGQSLPNRFMACFSEFTTKASLTLTYLRCTLRRLFVNYFFCVHLHIEIFLVTNASSAVCLIIVYELFVFVIYDQSFMCFYSF